MKGKVSSIRYKLNEMYIRVKDTRKSKDPSSNCLHGKNGSLSKPDIYGQEPHISFRQVIYYVDR